MEREGLERLGVTRSDVSGCEQRCYLTLGQLVGLPILELERLHGGGIGFSVVPAGLGDHLGFRQLEMFEENMIFVLLAQLDIGVQEVVESQLQVGKGPFAILSEVGDSWLWDAIQRWLRKDRVSWSSGGRMRQW